jgi:hypothetical protein
MTNTVNTTILGIGSTGKAGCRKDVWSEVLGSKAELAQFESR